MQYALKLIDHDIQGSVVHQRASDGYINATAMCRAAGKLWGHYNSNATTKAYLAALESDIGIPISELIQSVKGGDPAIQGTWVHPDIAIHLAQWLSPAFAVRVTRWVREWLSGGGRHTYASYHLRRYSANLENVPYGHFSILQEMMISLIGPMEARGYVMPERMMPDISQGRMFCKFLREKHGVDTESLPKYMHDFEDGRCIPANAYPNRLLEPFRSHFFEVWVPQKAQQYFATRDPVALEYLPYLLPRPSAA